MQPQNSIPASKHNRDIRGIFVPATFHPDPILAANNCSVTLPERFFSKVTKTEGCWLWTGARKQLGYGQLAKAGNTRGGIGNIPAHKASWLIHNGEIPDGMELLLICPRRDRACVNPNHWLLGHHSDIKRFRDAKHIILPLASTQLERAVLLCQQGGITLSEIEERSKPIHQTPQWLLDEGFTENFCDRFWAKVEHGPFCWKWLGARTDSGHGAISTGQVIDGKEIKIGAHRAAWILANGAIPEGQQVLHDCTDKDDHPWCVNPDHLKLGTNVQNTIDAVRKCKARGVGHWNARVTIEQVRAIRVSHSEGQSIGAISRRFGISRSHVSNIVNGKTWKHYQ